MRLLGVLIAPAARAWLSDRATPARPVLSDSRAQARADRGESPAPLTIHSQYQHSVNLVNQAGELLSLVTQDLGPGPFALVVRPDTPGFIASGGFEANLEHDSPIAISEDRLSIGPLEVDHARAADWKPRPSWELVGAERIAANLPLLHSLLRQQAPTGSFAPLAGADAAQSASAHAQEIDLTAAALVTAAEPARKLIQGLRARDPAIIVQAAERLAGLGGGVTPSGDDYLLGAIHALWALAEPSAAQALGQSIAGAASPRTNRISAAWLQAAGRGEAGNEWHVLAVALASGAPPDEPAAWLIQRGHTSGADALAGFLAAAAVLLEPP